MLPSVREQVHMPPQTVHLAFKFGLICPHNQENDRVCLTHIHDVRLRELNELLVSKGRDQIEDGIVSTLTKVSVNGFVVHGRRGSKAKGNSYTVQFEDHSYDPSLGYTDMFIQHQNEIYAVIQRLQMHGWPACGYSDDHLSDIVAMYGNLQEHLYDHVIPVQETNEFVAIEVRHIKFQVVCVKMDGSSLMYVCKFPNMIESD
jgi:hypothetical protein